MITASLILAAAVFYGARRAFHRTPDLDPTLVGEQDPTLAVDLLAAEIARTSV